MDLNDFLVEILVDFVRIPLLVVNVVDHVIEILKQLFVGRVGHQLSQLLPSHRILKLLALQDL